MKRGGNQSNIGLCYCGNYRYIIAVRKPFSLHPSFLSKSPPLNIQSFRSLIFWFDCKTVGLIFNVQHTARHASSLSDNQNTTQNKTKNENMTFLDNKRPQLQQCLPFTTVNTKGQYFSFPQMSTAKRHVHTICSVAQKAGRERERKRETQRESRISVILEVSGSLRKPPLGFQAHFMGQFT